MSLGLPFLHTFISLSTPNSHTQTNLKAEIEQAKAIKQDTQKYLETPESKGSAPISPLEKQNQKLKTKIEKALNADLLELKRGTSKFLENPGSQKLHQPVYGENTFHPRNPALNDLPLFYSQVDTEIAAPDALKTLPPMQQALASIRLIGKRFINAETGLSLDGSGKKGNPHLHEQRLSTRAIRSEAATTTITHYNGKYIRELYNHVLSQIDFSQVPKKPVTVYLVRPARNPIAADTTINFLSLAAQTEVANSLNYLAKTDNKAEQIYFSDERTLPMLNRTARSNASPLGRLVQQCFYDASGFPTNDLVILVDDHSQTGASLLTMASALNEKGARILAAVTPTVHPFSKKLGISPAVKKQLHTTLQDWDPEQKLAKKLETLGMPLETLTDHEAMIIIAYATDPKSATQCATFAKLEKALTGQGSVLEGDSDSLKPVLEQEPLPVEELLVEMETETEKNRKIVTPLQLETVHVLDWDDFLRDEKGLNYRLMHNAIAKAAKEYGAKHPFLIRLNQALSAKRGHYEEGQGMPLLSMTQAQFQKTTIGNTKVLKRDAIDDLLNHLDGLEPGLQQAFTELQSSQANLPKQAQETINNILWHTFRREYQASIKPQPKPIPEEYPFQDTQPHLMPGAEALLNSLHRPENFVSLISNRPQTDLEKEINQMGLAHYFDDVQGTPSILTSHGEKATLSDARFKKPHPHRLQNLLEQNPLLEKVSQWHFWGDTPKDIMQASGFLRDNTTMQTHQVQGTLVNPNPFLLNDLKKEGETDKLLQAIHLNRIDTLEDQEGPFTQA